MRHPSYWLKVLLFTLFANLLYGANTPYSYSYIPKTLYKNQFFPVTVLVKHYNPKDPPHFEYDSLSLIQPENYKPMQVVNKNEAFYTFYFKAPKDKESLLIPTLTIWNMQNTYVLQPKTIPLKSLESNSKNYIGLLASSLRINSVKVDTYDDKNSLITLNVEATDANIEDLHIPKSVDDGIENIQRDGARATANYYFAVPSSQKFVILSYYNLIKNRFTDIKVNITNSSNSQELDQLNPKELNFETVKKYTLIFLTALFLLLAYISRDYLYLLLSAVMIALLIYLYIPNRTVCVPEGTSLYILPTNNSNIITRIDQEHTTSVLNSYQKFLKIDYKNIKGWIKDENLCKN